MIQKTLYSFMNKSSMLCRLSKIAVPKKKMSNVEIQQSSKTLDEFNWLSIKARKQKKQSKKQIYQNKSKKYSNMNERLINLELVQISNKFFDFVPCMVNNSNPSCRTNPFKPSNLISDSKENLSNIKLKGNSSSAEYFHNGS